MAARRPLVLVSGRPFQLADADTLLATLEGPIDISNFPADQLIHGPVDTELPAAVALADGAAAGLTTVTLGAVGLVMNDTTLDRQRAVIAGLNSVGTGIAAAGLVGQLDDVSPAAVTENQFAPVRISSRRALLVEGVSGGTAQQQNLAQWGGAAVAAAVTLGDGGVDVAAAPIDSRASVWDGSQWNKARGNVEAVAFASAARTASTFSAAIPNHNGRGLLLGFNVQVASGTGSLTLQLYLYDANGSFYLAYADAAPLTAVGQYGYLFYPGLPAVAGGGSGLRVTENLVIPRRFLLGVIAADGSSYTYAVGYTLIV